MLLRSDVLHGGSIVVSQWPPCSHPPANSAGTKKQPNNNRQLKELVEEVQSIRYQNTSSLRIKWNQCNRGTVSQGLWCWRKEEAFKSPFRQTLQFLIVKAVRGLHYLLPIRMKTIVRKCKMRLDNYKYQSDNERLQLFQ